MFTISIDIIFIIILCVAMLSRFQPLPVLVERLEKLRNHYRCVTKQCDRLKAKLQKATEAEGLSVDDQCHSDLQEVKHV